MRIAIVVILLKYGKLSEFPTFQQEFYWGEMARGRMRANVIVHPNPCLSVFADFGQAIEHIAVQYVVTECSVKALNQTVLSRFAWLDIFPFNPLALTPLC